MVKVVNKYKEPYDVYIGRGSKWGNPFKLISESERNNVIEKYRQHLWKQIQSEEVTKQDLLELDGKVLGCFCKPKKCHGDVIVAAVTGLRNRSVYDRL